MAPGTARARTYLDTAIASLRAAGLRARPLVRIGPVVPTVLDTARRFRVDLIILGRTAQSGFSRLFSGGLASAVIRQAPCPVLLVPPRPPHRSAPVEVRDFSADASRAGALAPQPLGSRTVELTRVVGSVGRHANLRRDFQPRRSGPVEGERQRAIWTAMERDRALPLVDLYKVGYGYYVFDGHHRVAAARALGQEWIDADVTEFLPLDDPEAQRIFSERRMFERETGLTRVGAARPDTYGRLREIIDNYSAASTDHAEPDLTATARRWYAQEFRPVQLKLRAARVSERYPGERTADLFVRLAEHRRMRSARGGADHDWVEALRSFAAA